MAPKVSTEQRLARILAMVPWVIAHRGPAVADVCARFGITPQELVADIELLYLCGLHPYTPELLIEAEIRDDRVWVDYADYFRHPLRLTPAESIALVLAASTLLATPGTDPQGSLASGLAKLTDAMGGAGTAVAVALGDADPAVLDLLRQAAASRRQVDIDYYAYARDERTRRTVEPAGVFTSGGEWYVSAYCHSAGADRTFRVDRILAATALGSAATAPRAPASPALFRTTPQRGEVVLALTPASEWVVESYPVQEVSTETAADGSTRRLVRLAVSEWAWLDRLVLRLGTDAEVRSAPPGWPGRRAAAARVLARYG